MLFCFALRRLHLDLLFLISTFDLSPCCHQTHLPLLHITCLVFLQLLCRLICSAVSTCRAAILVDDRLRPTGASTRLRTRRLHLCFTHDFHRALMPYLHVKFSSFNCQLFLPVTRLTRLRGHTHCALNVLAHRKIVLFVNPLLDIHNINILNTRLFEMGL